MKKGRVVHSPLFLLRVLVEGGEPARIAATVPQKVAKKAVSRVRIRRIIYDAVLPSLSGLKNGLKVIIFAKGGDDLEPAIVRADLEQVFVKANLMQ